MNIAFYPFWAARTLLSLIQVISITTLTYIIYRQTQWIGYALLFLFVYLLVQATAGITLHLLMKRNTLSRLMISIPLTKALLLIGISFSLPLLKLHIVLMCLGALFLLVVIRWEAMVLERLQPRLVGGEDIAKTDNLLSFSNYTITGIGLIMTVITILYLGPTQALWAAAALSLAVLALIVTIRHLTYSTSCASISMDTRRPLHK
ncbi:hypothetical protein AB4Z30_17735 [Paenibacillus sp. 2TAF8]|jgi:hypothetical protein|uniref:hypothetical protein n=1 Tax=Paenibacillus sp. 2TAF8 TaxID=3233020 RepID=UPI003F965DF1